MTTDVPPQRLARECQRLFGSAARAAPAQTDPTGLLLLGVARPAAWSPLAAVCRGVQTDFGLPAPAIVVDGEDGLQLWWGVAEPVDASDARAVLERWRQRYMADVPRSRVLLQALARPPVVPAAALVPERWSAFVAADLAPLFEDTPWLDLPPTDEGQADLLSRLSPIAPSAWREAIGSPSDTPVVAAAPGPAPPAVPSPGSGHHAEAAAFLLQVMRDSSAPLALRIEAAKALLPYATAGG